jgi:hypothetical protein
VFRVLRAWVTVMAFPKGLCAIAHSVMKAVSYMMSNKVPLWFLCVSSKGVFNRPWHSSDQCSGDMYRYRTHLLHFTVLCLLLWTLQYTILNWIEIRRTKLRSKSMIKQKHGRSSRRFQVSLWLCDCGRYSPASQQYIIHASVKRCIFTVHINHHAGETGVNAYFILTP